MDVALPRSGAAVDELQARGGVTLEFPAQEGSVRRIRAQTLAIGRDAGEGERTSALAVEPSLPSTTPAGRGAPGSEAPPAGVVATGVEVPAGGGAPGSGLLAVFDGNVEMRESDAPPGAGADDRIMRADRMESVLSEGLAQLTQTRFVGNVRLESGRIGGRGR